MINNRTLNMATGNLTRCVASDWLRVEACLRLRVTRASGVCALCYLASSIDRIPARPRQSSTRLKKNAAIRLRTPSAPPWPRLKSQVAKLRESDTRKLRDEYQRLLQGLDSGVAPVAPMDLVERGSPLPGGGGGGSGGSGSDGSGGSGGGGGGGGGGSGAAAGRFEIPEDLLQQAIPVQIKQVRTSACLLA